jgi:signal transduction histidine kinase
VVADDGVGFDLENVRADGYGLNSMQDRAARAGVALTFVTEPGAGTEVVASWSP